MNKESIDSIVNAIKPVAEKIGEGATHLYEIYTRQMVAEGVAGLITTGLFLLICIALWWVLVATLRAEKPNEDAQALAFGAAVIVTALVLFFGGMNLTDNITKIANPEYHAVQRVLDTVKGKE